MKEESVTVDGHAARFLVIETNDRSLVRSKVFAVKKRLYVATVIVKKGTRLGFNSQNDFELSAMTFLDSIHVNPPSN